MTNEIWIAITILAGAAIGWRFYLWTIRQDQREFDRNKKWLNRYREATAKCSAFPHCVRCIGPCKMPRP